MSLAWSEWEQDLLRREPKPQLKVPPKPLKWGTWDWFYLAFAVCAVIGLIVVWIGDFAV